jgi:acyl carrier protein
MDEVKKRLLKCFETVFPDQPADVILRASQESLPGWDSVAAITLVNVMEDEFGFAMDFDLLPELTSFDRVLLYVQKHVQG